MSTEALIQELSMLQGDFLYYAPKCLKIKAKDKTIKKLVLNKAQKYVHDRLQAQLAETGKVRALILKARQQGFSTYIGGRFYWKTSLNPGTNTYILTHEQTATDNLFAMVGRYHDHSPLKPVTGASNAKELNFPKLDGGYAVGTAGSKAVGRSKTIFCSTAPSAPSGRTPAITSRALFRPSPTYRVRRSSSNPPRTASAASSTSGGSRPRRASAIISRYSSRGSGRTSTAAPFRMTST
jgi:hypothetical protein